MRLLLIPLASCAPAIHDYLNRLESKPVTLTDLTELSRLMVSFVAVSEALLEYTKVLAGRPCSN